MIDSGSTDGTVAIASRYADHVVEIPPEEFSYGGTLNLGSRLATTDPFPARTPPCREPRSRSAAFLSGADRAPDLTGGMPRVVA